MVHLYEAKRLCMTLCPAVGSSFAVSCWRSMAWAAVFLQSSAPTTSMAWSAVFQSSAPTCTFAVKTRIVLLSTGGLSLPFLSRRKQAQHLKPSHIKQPSVLHRSSSMKRRILDGQLRAFNEDTLRRVRLALG